MELDCSLVATFRLPPVAPVGLPAKDQAVAPGAISKLSARASFQARL